MENISQIAVRAMMMTGTGTGAGSKIPRIELRFSKAHTMAFHGAGFLKASNTLKEGLVLDTTNDERDRDSYKVILTTKDKDVRLQLASRFAGVDESLLFITEPIVVPAKLINGSNGARIVMAPLNVLTLPKRTPVHRPHKNGQTPEPPKPEAPQRQEADDIEQLKLDLLLVSTTAPRNALEAVVRIHRLANKLHVRLRLRDDDNEIIGIREVEL